MLGIIETKTARQSARLLGLLALTSVLALAPKTARAQVTTVNCGTENGRVCSGGDPEYNANNVDGGQVCDYGLQPSGHTCVNQTRHMFADYRGDNVGKVLHDQLYSTQADQPINRDVFLGSHNSFSSYRSDIRPQSSGGVTVPDPLLGGGLQVGLTPGILADQELSISDQLSSGARFLVLHPHFYHGELRVCHENFNDTFEDLICGGVTYGRLFSYVAQEVGAWLDKNPGEFVIVRLYHDVGAQHTAQLAHILNPYLGSKIFKPDYATLYKTGTFPSLRQLRTKGYQVMLIGSEADDNMHTISQILWDWSTIVIGDGYTDATGWGNCQNTDGVSVDTRPFYQFAFVGEDRSGSNGLSEFQLAYERYYNDIKNLGVTLWNGVKTFFTGSGSSPSSYDPGGAGLLRAGDVQRAVNCTYGLIGLDFWAAGANAYFGDPLPIVPQIPVSHIYEYRFFGPDERQAAALWTYHLQNSASFTNPAPVSMDATGWHPDDPNVSYPYLCANLGSINGVPPNREQGLELQTTAKYGVGTWTDGGEATCQLFGSSWHFWAPETPFQQAIAQGLAVANNSRIWLNMKIAPPNQRPPLVITPSTIQPLSWLRDRQGPPAMPYIFTKGGTGGNLTARVARADGDKIFLTVSNDGSTIGAAVPLNLLTGLSTGLHNNIIEITETDPVYGPQTYSLPVQLEVDEPLEATAGLVSIDNCSPAQSVTLFSGGPFTTSSDQKWLKVSASSTQTPATLTFGYLPASRLAAGLYTANVTISGNYASNHSVTLKVNLQISPETTIASNPSGLSLTVDGKSITTPASYCWATGQPHELAASPLISGLNGTGLLFGRWNDSGPAKHTITTTSSTSAVFTADYKKAFFVTTAANPANGGTVTGGGWYADGREATLQATPSSGFSFAGFAGPQDRTENPYHFAVTAPVTVTATFAAPGAFLFASTDGPRLDGSTAGTRDVPLQIVNSSTGGFGDVQVTVVDGFQTVAGTGSVQLSATTFPIRLGNLSSGGSGKFNVLLNWPTTASRVSFKVKFVANGGAYAGSTTLTVNR